MFYVFTLLSPALPCGTPASVLHGEEWTFQAVDLPQAERAAARRLTDVFRLASRERQQATSIHLIATFASRRDYMRALDEARESGVALVGNDADAVIGCLLGDDLQAVGS